jgi:hypothetical protein
MEEKVRGPLHINSDYRNCDYYKCCISGSRRGGGGGGGGQAVSRLSKVKSETKSQFENELLGMIYKITALGIWLSLLHFLVRIT